MATRPGFIWSGTEWVAIGQEAIVNPFYYQATAPSTPSTGDIWIESDVDVPSVDSAQFLRWRKTMTGGETSLSGNDDSSLPLQYTPGYEQLYINGVLMVRGQDYTATTGTTVTGLTALTVNDVVEVFSTLARTVADVYTQTQADAKYALQTDFPAGTWTSYTPSLSGMSIGNGTLDFKYSKTGKTVHVRGTITLGSTSTVTGPLDVGCPVTSVAYTFAQSIGMVAFYNATNLYFGTNVYIGNTGVFRTVVYNSAGTYTTNADVTSAIPFGAGGWTTGRQVMVSYTYEAA